MEAVAMVGTAEEAMAMAAAEDAVVREAGVSLGVADLEVAVEKAAAGLA